MGYLTTFLSSTAFTQAGCRNNVAYNEFIRKNSQQATESLFTNAYESYFTLIGTDLTLKLPGLKN
jgi:hypothetical protein